MSEVGVGLYKDGRLIDFLDTYPSWAVAVECASEMNSEMRVPGSREYRAVTISSESRAA